MYLHLSSSDCLSIHPANKWSDFIVTLPQPISLDNEDEWEIALIDLWFSKSQLIKERVLYVFCDICENSVIKGSQLPVLSTLLGKQTPQNPYYIRVTDRFIRTLRISIKNSDLKTPQTEAGPLILCCTLQLEKRWHRINPNSSG